MNAVKRKLLNNEFNKTNALAHVGAEVSTLPFWEATDYSNRNLKEGEQTRSGFKYLHLWLEAKTHNDLPELVGCSSEPDRSPPISGVFKFNSWANK